MHVVQAPLHEVFAIVGEQPVTFLAEPGARTLDHFHRIERRLGM
jgi:hypothetical protein